MKIKQASFFERDIVKFAAVGVVSTTADILVLTLLSRFTDRYIAVALGFMVGLTVGFVLNSQFVFKVEQSSERYLKYGLISVGGLLITEVIVSELLGRGVTEHQIVAKLFAVFVVFFWNFGWSKIWAFR